MGIYDIRDVVDGQVKCSCCGEIKDEIEFHNSASTKNTSGKVYHCRVCISRKQKEYRKTETGFKGQLWNNLKGNAKRRGLPVEINKEYIDYLYNIQGSLCAVTGFPMEFSSGEGSKNDYAVSVDRINSDGAYTFDNVRLVCARVNIIRQELTDNQMAFWCKAITKGNDK